MRCQNKNFGGSGLNRLEQLWVTAEFVLAFIECFPQSNSSFAFMSASIVTCHSKAFPNDLKLTPGQVYRRTI